MPLVKSEAADGEEEGEDEDEEVDRLTKDIDAIGDKEGKAS